MPIRCCPLLLVQEMLQQPHRSSAISRRRIAATAQGTKGQNDSVEFDGGTPRKQKQKHLDPTLLQQSAEDFLAAAAAPTAGTATVVAVKTPRGLLLLEAPLVAALENLVVTKTGTNPKTAAAGRALLLQLLQLHADNCTSLQHEQEEQHQQQQQEDPMQQERDCSPEVPKKQPQKITEEQQVAVGDSPRVAAPPVAAIPLPTTSAAFVADMCTPIAVTADPDATVVIEEQHLDLERATDAPTASLSSAAVAVITSGATTVEATRATAL